LSDNEVKDYGPNKAVVNATVQWPDLRLSEQIKHLRFFRDKDNNIVAMPCVLFDPTQTGLNVLPMGRVGISDPGGVNTYARVYGLPCCGWPETTLGLVTHSTQMLQKDVNLEAKRTQTIRKLGFATNAGNTALWTPVAGRRFRLLGLDVFMAGGCTLAAASIMTVAIRDAALEIFSWGPYINNAAIVGLGTYINKTIIFPDNGYLSAAVNNVLNINLGAALTTGVVSVAAWGTEEV